MRFYNKRKGKKGFISLAMARSNSIRELHNGNIERVTYCNSRVTKPLFFVGAVLPDFKISWGVLLVYLVVKYPVKLSIVMKYKYSDVLSYLRAKFYLLVLKGGIKENEKIY